MRRFTHISFLVFVSVLLWFFSAGNSLYAQNALNLKDEINQRSEELKEIQAEQKQIQGDINNSISGQRTLKRELKNISYNVSQLDLGIRASEITIEKLLLEIEDIEGTIVEAEAQITDGKVAIAQLVREINASDKESLLIVFLRNKTLSDSFGDIQSLNVFASDLSVTLDGLNRLKADLESALSLGLQKKGEKEIEQVNLTARKNILNDQTLYKKDLLSETKNQESAYRKSLESLREQQSAIAEDIERLEEELRKQIDPSALPSPRPGVLAWPSDGILTQTYGATSFAKYRYRSKWHNGLDIAASLGTPVYAAEGGRVIEIWNQDKYCRRGAYGKFIVIEHENNLTTLYAHLSAFLPSLNVDDIVERGELIGYMGSSGNSTGSHVHFGVYSTATFRIGPSRLSCGPKMPFGGDLSPLDYLP